MSNLPPLPSTNLAWKTPTTCGGLAIEPLFTADQMRAYAAAALAAQAAELEALRNLLKEARKIVRASSARNLVKDWAARATAALKEKP